MMRNPVPASAVLLLGLACPAVAQTDALFAGIVVDTCVVVVAPGEMFLNNAGTILGSNQGIGQPARATIVSIGPNQISLSEPELLTAPSGYSEVGQTMQISTGGIVSNALTALGLNFDIGLLASQILEIDLQIENENGFPQGAYTARTVLTCE
jgi:hypothetical protein